MSPPREPIVPEEQHFILSTLSPGAMHRWLALVVICVILTVFTLIAFGPLRGVQPGRIGAFVPIYATAMFVCDSITALLLYAQFSIVRSRPTLVIASGYLFMALMLIPWVLVFPGLLGPAGLMGGLQSTSWIYFLQHAGFSMFVIGYALSKNHVTGRQPRDGTGRAEIGLSIVLTVTLVLALALLCIDGEPLLLPVVLDSIHLGPQWPYVGAPVGLLSIAAIVILWTRRRTVLDLWLTVVMVLFAIEIPLSYYPDPERFSIGWYAVRLFGILASTIILMLLLYEITTLYARLLGAVSAQRREREARLMTGDAVAASIAHEVRQPLTAMVTTADAGLRFLDRPVPNLGKAKEAFRNIAADGHRAGMVVGSIRANFKKDAGDKSSLDLNELVQETLALVEDALQRHHIAVQIEPREQWPLIEGNRVQLQQVFHNLIMNAVDAMAVKEEPRVLSVRSAPYGHDRALVSIADTGSGISSQLVERIFNPLFTTKADGMGMGLSICRAIIEAHEGRLWFTPNRPRGAIFQFTLQTPPASIG